jgi:hypothetical protein
MVNSVTKPPKYPSNRELLERVAALEAKNAWLESHIERIYKGNNRLAQQVGGLLHQVGLIDLQVIELAEKVFPGYVRTQQQIMEVLTPPNKAKQQRRDQPD